MVNNNNVKVITALIETGMGGLHADDLAIKADIKRADVAAKSAREMSKLTESGIGKYKVGRKTYYEVTDNTIARDFLNKLTTKKVKMSSGSTSKKVYPIEDILSLDLENTRVIFKQGKKYGIKDGDGKIIVESKYSFMSMLVNYDKTVKMGLILSDD